MALNLFNLSAELTVDTTDFDKGLKKAEDTAEEFSDKLGKTFGDGPTSGVTKANKSMGMFSVFAGNILSSLTESAISTFSELVSGSLEVASDLQESQNVVDTTFGESAEVINQWARDAKTAYGMSELSAKKYNGTMGAMLKSMGMTDAELVNMSTSLVGLAGDMASFYNLDHDTAFEKIRSGISGETEPLKQLGINMSVANLEAFALAKGIKKAYDKMSEAEKVQLRYEYLMETTADAQGDFAKTADSYANQSRILALNVETLQANIGEALLPVVNDVITAINSMFSEPPKDKLSDKLSAMETTVGNIKSGLEESYSKYEASMDEIDAKASLAGEYLAVIEALEGSEILTDAEVATLNNAAVALENMYGIDVWDEDNNAITKTTEEIRDLIAAYEDLARETALGELLEGINKERVNIAKQRVEAQILLSSAEEAYKKEAADYTGLIGALEALAASGGKTIPAMYAQYTAGIKELDSYYERDVAGAWNLAEGANPQKALTYAEDVSRKYVLKEKDEAHEAWDNLESAQQVLEDLDEAGTQLTEKATAYIEAYTELTKIPDELKTSAEEAQTEIDGLGESAENVSGTYPIIFEFQTIGTPPTVGGLAGGGDRELLRSDISAHATGLDYVPYDDYLARLHEGEAVLTKLEAENWRNGATGETAGEIVTVNVNLDNVSIRDERDIETLAQQIARYTRRQNYGVGAVAY